MISVVIPAYNSAKYIETAINSVLNQTYQDFEIIIIDDGSVDNTKELIENLNDKRIKYIFQINQGVSAARNNGINHSNGEYIAFLDADDYWQAEKLDIQLKIFNNNPEIKLVFSNITMVEELTGIKFVKKFKNFKTQTQLIKNMILTPYNTPSPCTVMIKKEVLNIAGLFDPKINIGEDLDLWLRIALCSNFHCVEKPLATAIRSQTGLTRTVDSIRIIEQHTYILNKFFNETDKNKKYTKYKKLAFAFIYFNIGFHYLFASHSAGENIIKTQNIFMKYTKIIIRKITYLFLNFI